MEQTEQVKIACDDQCEDNIIDTGAISTGELGAVILNYGTLEPSPLDIFDNCEKLEQVEQDVLDMKGKKFRNYSMTWNNYAKEDIVYLENYAKNNCSYYVFQEEIGKNGTPHLQIALEFKNTVSFLKLKKDFPKCHIEVTRKKFAARQYCQKEDTKVGETKKKTELVLENPYKEVEPYMYQDYVENLIKQKPDRRTIHWFVDTKGNMGKSILVRSILIENKDTSLMLSGKANDMKYAIAQFIEGGRDLKIVLMDFPRSLEDKISYAGIEDIKNATFFSAKYEGKQIMYNFPHVIIFSNWYTKITEMSRDRWCIYLIDDKGHFTKDEIK